MRIPIWPLLVVVPLFLTSCRDAAAPELSQPSTLLLVSGDAQQVLNGPGAATQPLVVRVVDPMQRGVPGVQIIWTPSDPSGSVSPGVSTTNAEGVAETRWTLGAIPGLQTVRASTSSLPGSAVLFQGESVVLGIQGSVTLDPRPAVALHPGGEGGWPLTASAFTPGSGIEPVLPSTLNRRLIVRLRGGGIAQGFLGGDPGSPTAVARSHEALQATVSRLKGLGVTVGAEYSPVLGAVRITLPPGGSVDAVRALLLSDPQVSTVTPDLIVPIRGDGQFVEAPSPLKPAAELTAVAGHATGLPRVLPRNPLLPQTLWHYNAVDAPKAWATTTGSAEVLVAVVDDGIRFDHPGISANLTNDGYNFVSGGDLVGEPVPLCSGGMISIIEAGVGPDPTLPVAYDWTGECLALSPNGNHGLHVAGTIGAVGDDGVGIPGINWRVRIRPVRVLNVLGSGSWFDVAQGVLYAAGLPASNGAGGTVVAPSRARIINMSLGGSGADPLLSEAVQAATQAGSLVIASAGNGASSGPSYPAAFPSVLSVASVGPELQPAYYTNVGTTVDLAAPGGDFRSGAAVYSTTWNFQTGAPNYSFYQGTSMAAPHVAGIAALVLAREPNLTVSQLRARLVQTAVRLGPPGWDPRYGHGLVNAYNAVHNVTGLPRNPLVRVHDVQTGAILATVRPNADGHFSLMGLAPGRVYVVAGEEEAGDGTFAIPGRRAGWYGAPGGVQEVVIGPTGTRVAQVGIHLGVPHEVRPNDAFERAHRLFIGSLVVGRITREQQASYFVIRIPAQGAYTFETAGVLGSCGYGTEVDTVLTLYDAERVALAENDDTLMGDALFCSRIERSLQPGTYYLRVNAFGAGRGSFALMVRGGGA